jgi:acyl-CoA synthetase (AMP-forming)/AMP-acid ligase II
MSSSTTSLSHLLRDAIARHAAAGRTALLGPFGSTSYARLGAQVDGYASAMRGVTRGEPVGILGSRSVESVALFFGIMQAGGCPCFMEPGLETDAVVRRMKAVGMHRIVLEDESQSMTRGLEQGGRRVRHLADLSPLTADSERGVVESLTTSDRAMLQFTSGSTGQPKGVPLSHGNLRCQADGIIAHTSLTPADRLLHVMPLHHTNGVNNQLIAPFLAGASVALVDRFQAEQIEDQIGEYGATYMTGVPTMYSRVLPYLRDRAKRRSLRFLRCGSAPITVQLHQQIEAAFGVPLVVSYGLSEATCTSTMNPPDERRAGTVGTVLRGQQVRLFRPGTSEEVPPGTEGEICISGPCVTSGYVGTVVDQPIRDGWLRSGDLGQFDADGYLSITGRIKDVIIRGGENLSPRLIEDAVRRHPAVLSCCVIGGPHADLGEVPVAFVRLRDGETPRPDDVELRALVAKRLPRTHVPADIRFVDTWPETSVGKIDRQALRKALRSSAAQK